MRKLFIIMALGLLGCSDPSVNLKVEEIKDGLVRISVENQTETDFKEMTFILRYFDKDKQQLLSDTISYRVEQGYFLSAKNNTFFVQKVPEGTISVKASLKN